MKLIVQIPCYNEEKTLPQTVADIPRRIEGIDTVEILVIDDGSTDRTVETAKALGVDHIVRHKRNRGLALTFMTGLETSLRLGADIIVNTDGDNQYHGADIPKLIEPIVAGEADMVIGDRQTEKIEHFGFLKKKLQKTGSQIVRVLSNTDVPDAVSGFRAFSRQAALQINIVSRYSYTVETVIQAGDKRMKIASVPVRTNPKTRESRLITSIPRFVLNQVSTMVRMYTMFRPLKMFFMMGGLFVLGGLIPTVRFLYFYLLGQGDGHIQSLVLAAVLILVGIQLWVLGLLGDVISFNRKLIEEALLRVRRIELKEAGRQDLDSNFNERVIHHRPGETRDSATL
jgi:glycosyltransferase involved in cell wall biosynthesis